MTEREPTRGETTTALRLMITLADERGSYLLDGIGARYLEAALKFMDASDGEGAASKES